MYNFKKEVSLKRRNIQSILTFYLFECPVPNKSFRGKKFNDFGWKGKHFNSLKASMLKDASPSLKSNYFPSKKDELELNFSRCHINNNRNIRVEAAVFLKTDEKLVIESLFTAIRNAFAHGSFEVKKDRKEGYIYYFLNFHGYAKAKIVLYESTLLNWIKLIEGGPDN